MDKNVEYYPLTHPQKGIWYTEKLYPGTSIGNIAATLKIRGEIDYKLLEKAINLVVKKNDSFRTKIVEIDGSPYQYISQYQYQNIEVISFREDNIEKMYEWDTEQAQSPLDINNSEFCKFYLIRIDENYGGFFIKIHHTLADAWSVILFGNETMKFYNELKDFNMIDDKSFPSYIEYLQSEQNYLYSERFTRDKLYWKEKFSATPETSVLKIRKTNNIETNAKRKTFVLPVKLCLKINQYCSDTKTSILTLFISALSLYINRVTDKNDIVIGTPVLNRSNIKEKETIGMFINTIPIRNIIDENIDFSTFAQNVSRELFQSLKHQRYSIDFILNDIRESFKGVEKLFDICLSYQNAKFLKDKNIETQEGRWHFSGRQLESLYIHINEREGKGEIIIDYDYLSDLFCTKEINFIHDNLIRLLWHSLDNPTRKLPEIEMVSEREKQRIIYDFNCTDADFPKLKTIGEIFEEQVKLVPSNIALIYDNQSLTYEDLNKRVNKLARVLRKNGVLRDEIVGIIAYRSFDMIIGILAIIKSGGAYLPIDPEFPEERINYMLADSQASVLLRSSAIQKDIDFLGKQIYFEDIEVSNESSDNLSLINKPNDLVYVIYTSGSTGKPKGVMIEHHSVVNRINWMQKKYPINQKDVLLQKTPFTFDVSVWELTWWFFTGAGLAILKPGGENDPSYILNIINKNNVTVVHFVPSMLNAFLDYFNDTNEFKKLNTLKRVFASGEALTFHHVEKFNKAKLYENETSLHNLYGPTEATVDVSYFDCTTDDKLKVIPIGKPIDNIKIYILDKYHNVLPIGAVGELYIAGEGLARGYINNSELTEKRFIENPFIPGEKMYKTGDLARWFPKGDIEYLGRIDQQVKIRGYRIELGEIQNELLKMTSIKDAVVICKEDMKCKKYICAYLVLKYKVSLSDIKKHLLSNLPGYMIPSYFIELDIIPISKNGKIDIKLLPAPFNSAMKDTEFVEPRNDNEKFLRNIWERVLNVSNIGIKDNFFDIGGDSLSAMRIVSDLNGSISVENIYKNPTIELLSEFLLHKTNKDSLLTCLTDDIQNVEGAIICFPYGGGSSIVFRKFAKLIANKNSKYCVYAVGRSEYELNIEEITAKLVEEIIYKVPGNIFIYGHCVGSALALETVRQLEIAGKSIISVCFGGNFPPVLTKIFGRSINPWSIYSDKVIIRFLEYIGQKKNSFTDNMYKEVIEAFRIDVKKYYNYFASLNSKQIEKLNTKIINIIGDEDPLTHNYKTRYKAWYKYSDIVYLYSIKAAKHYFIETHANEVANIINRIIETGGECIANFT